MSHFKRPVVLLMGLSVLSACSTIKSVFPDKEKDYRFTRELPELVVPNDLGLHPEAIRPPQAEAQLAESAEPTEVPVKKTAPPAPRLAAEPLEPVAPAVAPLTHPAAAKPQAVTAPPAHVDPVPAADASSVVQTTPLHEEPIKASKYAEGVADVDALVEPQLTLKKTSERTAILQLNQNLELTWRIVGKALTREALEITERNTKAHYYVVLYDPTAKTLKDDSLLDEIGFMFGIENNQEEPYRIALTEKEKQTDIKILDVEGKTCSSDACVKLTKLLRTALEKSLKD